MIVEAADLLTSLAELEGTEHMRNYEGKLMRFQ